MGVNNRWLFPSLICSTNTSTSRFLELAVIVECHLLAQFRAGRSLRFHGHCAVDFGYPFWPPWFLGTGGIGEYVQLREPDFFTEVIAFFKMGIGLAGEADNDVGGEGGIVQCGAGPFDPRL